MKINANTRITDKGRQGTRSDAKDSGQAKAEPGCKVAQQGQFYQTI